MRAPSHLKRAVLSCRARACHVFAAHPMGHVMRTCVSREVYYPDVRATRRWENVPQQITGKINTPKHYRQTSKRSSHGCFSWLPLSCCHPECMKEKV